MPLHLLAFALSFVGIWIGSGLAIKSVERLSRSLHLSSFLVSFLILGFFTSISELSVGINSLIENDPEIYVGNLIGASIVIFMMIIPLLAITGNGIKIEKRFSKLNLLISLIVIAAPVLLVIDGAVTKLDSFICIGLYTVLLIAMQSNKGILEQTKYLAHTKIKAKREILHVAAGVAIIFVATRFIVDQTLYFSQALSVSPFLISLLVIGIGTNIPELSLVIRSLFLKSNQIAFGDYVGSAAFNTFLVGFLTLWHGKTVMLETSYISSLLFFIVGLVGFYYFARSNNTVSRLEALALFGLYILFFGVEVMTRSSHNVGALP